MSDNKKLVKYFHKGQTVNDEWHKNSPDVMANTTSTRNESLYFTVLGSSMAWVGTANNLSIKFTAALTHSFQPVSSWAQIFQESKHKRVLLCSLGRPQNLVPPCLSFAGARITGIHMSGSNLRPFNETDSFKT